MFLKFYNTEFNEIIITLTDQNGRPLGMEDKVNLTLLINIRNEMLGPRNKMYQGV